MSWLALLSFARTHWLAVFAALAAAAALAGSYELGCRYEKQDWQFKWSNRDAADAIASDKRDKATVALSEKYRRETEEHQQAADAARSKYEDEIQVRDSRIASLAAQRSGLLDTIKSYSSGTGLTTPASCSAISQRAQTLGLLLGQADERAQRDAQELEGLNSEKRLLIDSWPRQTSDQ